MTANAVVRARIDGRIKDEATAVLAEIGLTLSDAFRILLTRIAREKSLPFEPLVPNKETITAMEDSLAGRNMSHVSLDELQHAWQEESRHAAA